MNPSVVVRDCTVLTSECTFARCQHPVHHSHIKHKSISNSKLTCPPFDSNPLPHASISCLCFACLAQPCSWHSQHQSRACVQLPDAAWAQVLHSLSQEDLLNARLVSKTFVRLDQLSRLELEWHLEAEASASSLTLFVSRCLQGPFAPELTIYVGWGWLRNTHSWGVLLACTCRTLTRLSVATELALRDAEACLRLIPASITQLTMYAPEVLLSDPAWSRLRELRVLELQLSKYASDPKPSGSMLASLTSLVTLSLMFHDAPGPDSLMLDPLTSIPSGITSLKLGGGDPFQQQVHPGCFPDLQEFSWWDGSLPSWVESRHLQCIQVGTILQLAQANLKKLCCARLCIQSQPTDDMCKLWDLLQLPILTYAEIQIARYSDKQQLGVLLGGSHQEHQRFMSRVTTRLDLPARLCTAFSEGTSTSSEDYAQKSFVELRSNGHATICLCDICPTLS